MKVLIFQCVLLFSSLVLAHEGHEEMKKPASENTQEYVREPSQEGRPRTWTQWVGSFHLIFLHFPIALINMTAISECLFAWYRKPIFDGSSRFMLISAAIVAPFTALLGWIYSGAVPYSGLMEIFLLWHMWLGITTALLTVALAFMRERSGIHKLYYGCLALLVLLINITAFFGGGMTFGPYQMYVPL